MNINEKAIIESTEEARDAFGECWGAFNLALNSDDIRALQDGKTVAVKINWREYSMFITLK